MNTDTASTLTSSRPLTLTVLRTLAQSRTLLFALTFGAFALWLGTLTQRSVWADELGTIEVLRRRDLASLLAFVADAERRPPQYFVLLWLWTFIAGNAEFALRYFSLWFAALCVPLTLALARALNRLYTRTRVSPLLVTTLIVCSPTLALYGVMIRYYSFVLCLALALMLIFVCWLLCAQAGAASRERTALQVAWLLVALLLIYSDYSALALIGAQVIWLWSQQRALREWRVVLIALALAYIPLLASLLEQVGRAKQEADLSRDAIGVALKIGYPFYSFTFGETILPWHVAVVAAVPFVAIAFWFALRVLRGQPLARFALWHMLLPLAFNVLVLTAIATDLAFLTIASRTLFVLPLFLIWLASGIMVLPMRWRTLTTALLVGANLFALVNLFVAQQYHNPIYAVPMRAVADTIQRESQAGDIVVSDLDTVFYYYWYQQPHAGVTHYLSDDVELSKAKAGIADAYPLRVWLLVFGRDRSRENGHTLELEPLLAPHYTLASERDFAPVDALYRAVKTKLIGREAYAYKLVVRLYERKP